MPGTRANENCPGYENCSSSDPRVWNLQDIQEQDTNTYSIIHPRDQGVRKNAGLFFMAYESFQPKFDECNFYDRYSSYPYILTYFT